MAQTNAERQLLQSLTGDDSALSPEGSARVQERNGTYYLAIPLSKVRAHGLAQGDAIQRAYHPPTGCLLSCLDADLDLYGVMG